MRKQILYICLLLGFMGFCSFCDFEKVVKKNTIKKTSCKPVKKVKPVEELNFLLFTI
jgi:hypothetical protein